MKEYTDNLSDLRDGAPYVWGIIKCIHDIGPYSIVEYKPAPIKDSPSDSFVYSCYIDEKSIEVHSESLEGAIIMCISYRMMQDKTEAHNCAMAASKLLNIPNFHL